MMGKENSCHLWIKSQVFGLEDEEYMEAPASSSPAPSIRKTATKSQNTVEKQRDQSPKYNSQSTTNINQGAKSAASPTSRQTPRHNTKNQREFMRDHNNNLKLFKRMNPLMSIKNSQKRKLLLCINLKRKINDKKKVVKLLK